MLDKGEQCNSDVKHVLNCCFPVTELLIVICKNRGGNMLTSNNSLVQITRCCRLAHGWIQFVLATYGESSVCQKHKFDTMCLIVAPALCTTTYVKHVIRPVVGINMLYYLTTRPNTHTVNVRTTDRPLYTSYDQLWLRQ